jgi:hypothetical protein
MNNHIKRTFTSNAQYRKTAHQKILAFKNKMTKGMMFGNDDLMCQKRL